MDFDKFQQFQPKSLKEVLEETKQQQISRLKERAGEYKEHIQEWYREYRENYLESRTLQGDENWSPSGTTYRGDGNKIKFYDVVGGDGDNRIDMGTRTHDVIDGGQGEDMIWGGWGNDVISGGENSSNNRPDRDQMWGQEGHDVITAYARDTAKGGRDNDQLHGYRGSELWGEQDHDVFHVYAGDAGEGSDKPVEIHDFSRQDKIVINFEGVEYGGAENEWVGDLGRKTLVFDANRHPIAMINEVDLGDYSVVTSGDGMTMTITGSNFV